MVRIEGGYYQDCALSFPLSTVDRRAGETNVILIDSGIDPEGVNLAIIRCPLHALRTFLVPFPSVSESGESGSRYER